MVDDSACPCVLSFFFVAARSGLEAIIFVTSKRSAKVHEEKNEAASNKIVLSSPE